LRANLAGEKTVLDESVHPDLFVLAKPTDKQTMPVSEIHRLREFIHMSPFRLPFKMAIVDDAETLAGEGWNMLLKTLEEPAARTTIILVAAHARRIPLTIRSRAVERYFQRVQDETMIAALSAPERRTIRPHLLWIAGRPGLAKRLLVSPKDPLIQLYRRETARALKYSGDEAIRIQYKIAEELAKSESIAQSIDAWLLSLRSMHALGTIYPRLKRLKEAKVLIEGTNVNSRLAIEHALITPNQ